MSLEIALQENTAATRELIALLSAGVLSKHVAQAEPVAKPSAPEKKKPVPAKDTPAPAEEKKPEPAEAPAESAAAPAQDESAATYEDAKTAILSLSKEKGRDAAKGALQRFGVEKLPDMLPGQYGALVELVNEVLAGAEV